jgi:hypothetical protein
MVDQAELKMGTNPNNNNPGAVLPVPASWGPWLFRVALIATLAYFWWLVIYPHGVTGH